MATKTDAKDATPFVPTGRSLKRVREAATGCRGCPLWRDATQTVFGDGAARAELMLVGEQPGDQEDRRGKPFVGPAGKELERALEEAGIERKRVYVTNAVKHFKFEQRGKRRIHQRPTFGEIRACRPWLEREIEIVKPAAVVALGSTAARAVIGPDFRVTRDRGKLLESPLAPVVTGTLHPAAIVRERDRRRRAQLRRTLAADIARAAGEAVGLNGSGPGTEAA